MSQQTDENSNPITYWILKNDDNTEDEGNGLYFAGNIITLVITFILFRILIQTNLYQWNNVNAAKEKKN